MDTYDKSSHCGEEVTMDLVIAVDVSKAGPLRALKSRISSYLVRFLHVAGRRDSAGRIHLDINQVCRGEETPITV